MCIGAFLNSLVYLHEKVRTVYRLRSRRPVFYSLVLALLVALSACRSTSGPSAHGHETNPIGWIAFTSDINGNPDVYVVNLATNARQQVTNTVEHEYFPVWSPDGTQIAFGAKNQVFVTTIDGRKVIQLTRTYGRWEAFTPTWSPDGHQLAVASHGAIFRIPANEAAADTATWTQLTHLGNDVTPAWSSATDRIVFASVQQRQATLYTVASDGTGLQRLVTGVTPYMRPIWSPDGTHIAFVAAFEGNEDIYIMRIDGTGLQRLTTNAAQDTLPTWSPDGAFVAFSTNRNGNWDIYVVQVDGMNEQPLIATAANEEDPAWYQQ